MVLDVRDSVGEEEGTYQVCAEAGKREEYL